MTTSSTPMSSIESKPNESMNVHQNVLERKGYTLKEIIGKGSYAVVRKAVKADASGSKVAIKIISKEKAPADYVNKFLPREMDILMRLHHENIIPFIESIQSPSRTYIAMELATHGDLLDYIRKVKVVSEKRACRWFHHLLNGLSYCHENGIYHRDIKCENLLLDGNYVLKIADFGFARTDTATANDVQEAGIMLSTTFCGSYAYAAPEILKGEPYNMALADVWSMAVVLFTMTAGRLPFDDSNHQILLKRVQQPVVYSRRRPPSVGLRTLMDKMFQPAHDRIYFPSIRKDAWYVGTYYPNWDGTEYSQSSVQTQSSSRDQPERTSDHLGIFN